MRILTGLSGQEKVIDSKFGIKIEEFLQDGEAGQGLTFVSPVARTGVTLAESRRCWVFNVQRVCPGPVPGVGVEENGGDFRFVEGCCLQTEIVESERAVLRESSNHGTATGSTLEPGQCGGPTEVTLVHAKKVVCLDSPVLVRCGNEA